MKPKTIISILVGVALVAIVVLLVTGESKRSTDDNKVAVAATIFPLYDITRNIGGEHVDVVQILPSGASPHTYEVTPNTIEQLNDVDTVFAIGHSLDTWTSTITHSLDTITVVTVDDSITLLPFSEHHEHDQGHEHEHEDEEGHEHEEEGSKEEEHGEEEHHHEGDEDPHYWLSVTNAKLIAATIADELAALDPDHASYYQNNLGSYQTELNTLLAASQTKLAALTNKNMVVAHDAWQYFNNEFGLETVGTFQPSPGQEPTPQQLSELQKMVEEYGIIALFSEPQLSDDVIQPFAEDTGLPIYNLDPLGGVNDRQSYIELIQYNVDTIYSALHL